MSDKSNTSMMAAAPELYQACKELLAVNVESAGLTAEIVKNNAAFREFMRLNDARIKAACEKAQAAITRAEGK